MEASGTGVLDPAASGAVATDNADGTTTLAISVVDLCGAPIADLDPTVDFYVMDSEIGGPFYFGTSAIPGSEAAEWTEDEGTYTVDLARNFFDARPAGYEDGWYRIWHIHVLDELVEDSLVLQTSFWAVGVWEMDLRWDGQQGDRFIDIVVHDTVEQEITEGFFGSDLTDPGGEITGTIAGQDIYMFYDRNPMGVDYTAEFWGTIAADGNSMSGTWEASSGTTGTWTMTRQ